LFLICMIYFLLWSSWFRACQFLSFHWITSLSDMVIQEVSLSCWIKTLYEWKSYLQEFIKPLRHITDCHHFYIQV
jgi:hypothetical protein